MYPEFNKIKAILFDSGHTLNKPASGNWFVSPNYNKIIDTSKLDRKSFRFRFAMLQARHFLNKNHNIKTIEEEFILFSQFFEMLLKKAKYPLYDLSVIKALAEDIVYNDDKFIFFDDVNSSIMELHEKYLLGIVSITWPSLERIFSNAGLKEYFSTFVVSSQYNEMFSKKKLLKIALEELKVKPEETILVDDRDNNLIAAQKLGIIPIRINRYKTGIFKYSKNISKGQFVTIYRLKDLKTLLI